MNKMKALYKLTLEEFGIILKFLKQAQKLSTPAV